MNYLASKIRRCGIEEHHSAEARLKAAGSDIEQQETIARQLKYELAKLREKQEQEKDAVRDGS